MILAMRLLTDSDTGRYFINYRGRVFSIGVFGGELDGIALCEVEAGGLEELMAIEPPAYTRHEVTEDPYLYSRKLLPDDTRRPAAQALHVRLSLMLNAGIKRRVRQRSVSLQVQGGLEQTNAPGKPLFRLLRR